MRGAITAAACSVAPVSSVQIIDMGQFRSNQFTEVGVYAPPVPFSIELNDCSTAVSETAAISFLGVADTKDPRVLSIEDGVDTARGVGLAIFDHTGNLVMPNAQPHTLGLLREGAMSLRFIARYRATSRQVSGGRADAWTWFTVSYQ